jgi:transposase
MNEPKKHKLGRASGQPEVIIKLGMDVHAAAVVVAVQREGCLPQPAQKIRTEECVGWVKKLQAKHRGARIYACYEAGPCGYWLCRELRAIGVECEVIAPVALNGRRKTDERDARSLCELLHRYVAGNRKVFSTVHVPTPEQESERALIRHRQSLLVSLGRFTRQGRSALLLQGRREKGRWWGERRWPKLAQELGPELRLILGDLADLAQRLYQQIRALDKALSELAEKKQLEAPRGVGALTWLTLLTEVVDWSRFQNRRQVASYTGLCPGEHSSGGSRRELSVDKHGNRRVRRVLTEAAWRMLVYQPHYPPLKKVHAAASPRARKRAIVAVARRLAIDIWRLATGQTTPKKVGLTGLSSSLLAATT